MNSPRSLRALAALLVLLGSCATAPSSRPTRPSASADAPDTARFLKLTVVGTNDIHGWIEPHERRRISGGEPVLGGVDTLAGYLKILREKRPGGVLLLDAGDLFQGTLVANMTEGGAVVQAYNLLGYDAVAVGNHEFDYGPVGDDVVAVTPDEDPLGNLKKQMEAARFSFLTANITERATGKRPKWAARPTLMVQRKGVEIGIIGLTTPDTPSVTLAQNVAGLKFAPLAATALREARELRAQGAQVVVAVVHAGGGCAPGSDPHDLSTCDTQGEIFRMLDQLPPGTLDAAVAGHTHEYLANFINGVPAIQSGADGVAFGVIELWFDKKLGRVDPTLTKIWQPVPLCRKVFAATGDCRKEADGPLLPATFLGEQVRPSQAVDDALRPALRMVETRKEEPLGPELDFAFTRSRTGESPLGDLVADVLRKTVAGTQVAFTNSGGLRADLDPGPVTYGQVFDALPFENRIAVLQLTGAQLRAVLEQGVSGDHGVIQISGMRLEVGQACGVDPPTLLSATFDDGSPIDPAKTYQVLTNDFVATGGDGFGRVLSKVDPDQIRVRNDLPPLREVLVAYLRAHPELRGPPPPERPRLWFVEGACPSHALASPPRAASASAGAAHP